jgi:hypothetical protein
VHHHHVSLGNRLIDGDRLRSGRVLRTAVLVASPPRPGGRPGGETVVDQVGRDDLLELGRALSWVRSYEPRLRRRMSLVRKLLRPVFRHRARVTKPVGEGASVVAGPSRRPFPGCVPGESPDNTHRSPGLLGEGVSGGWSQPSTPRDRASIPACHSCETGSVL